MGVRMSLELLIPRRQNAAEPDLGSEVLGIARDFQ
jgi:hypothetical protein